MQCPFYADYKFNAILMQRFVNFIYQAKTMQTYANFIQAKYSKICKLYKWALEQFEAPKTEIHWALVLVQVSGQESSVLLNA